MYFVSYSTKWKGYILLSNLKTKKVITSRDMIVDEKASWNLDEQNIEKQVIFIDEQNKVK